MTSTMAIDIGGTSVKGARCSFHGAQPVINDEITISHDRNDMNSLEETVTTIAKNISQHGPISAIGISTTGSVRLNGVVAKGAFFDGYEEYSWEKYFKSIGFSVPVRVVNDGQAATFGAFIAEYKSKPNPFALFVIGTGIGGGFVLDGRLIKGAHGFGGAFGHIKVRLGNDQVCICGRVGCVENVGSARAIAARLQGPNTELTEINNIVADLHNRLQNGDETAAAMFTEIGSAIGLAIGDVANILDPELVALSGGIVFAATGPDGINRLVEAARKVALETCIPRISSQLRIEHSRIPYPNLIGAGVLASQIHSAQTKESV